MLCLQVLCVHHVQAVPMEALEGVRFPEVKLNCCPGELSSGPLQEQPMLLTSDQFLRLPFYF